jgi:hypothetical protein
MIRQIKDESSVGCIPAPSSNRLPGLKNPLDRLHQQAAAGRLDLKQINESDLYCGWRFASG